jgi:predicted  nucleic acid-binding Zn-ribbon protein
LAAKSEQLAVANEQISEANNQLTDLNKSVQAAKGKVLTQQQIEQIPIKISRPILGGEDTVTMPKKDWENIKKTALAQAQSNDNYNAALNQITALKNEVGTLKKEKAKWRKKYNDLENSTKENFMERATRDAELYNLKNDVAKIPRDIWDMHTRRKSKSHHKSQSKNHPGDVL